MSVSQKTENVLTVAMANAAAAEEIVNDLNHSIKDDGSVPFAADQSMGGSKLTNLSDPADPQDAATKAYVDAHSGGGGGGSTTYQADKNFHFQSAGLTI